MTGGARGSLAVRATVVAAMVTALCALAPHAAGAAAAVRLVPSQYPTIQAAVNASAAGDTIRVAPGTYQEKVYVKNHQTGLTIEAADLSNPPTILGTPNASVDGIRVDTVDGVHFRYLRIVGAYDGVRLNNVDNATLDHLYIENSALGVRFYNGTHNTLRDSTINLTRVEQGVYIDNTDYALVDNVAISMSYVDGIKVSSATGVVLRNVRVDNARHASGIYVYSSPSTTVTASRATLGGADGFKVSSSNTLVLTNNSATSNKSAGFRIQSSTPYTTVAAVTSSGNTVSGNLNNPQIIAK